MEKDDITFPLALGRTPLVDAIGRCEGKNQIDRLLASGADVNLANIQGLAPIHVAALGNDAELIEKLARHGADLNQADRLGNTATHLAAVMVQLSVAETLLKLDIDREAANANGQTAGAMFTTPIDMEAIKRQYKEQLSCNGSALSGQWEDAAL